MNRIINHKNDWYLKTETGYRKIIATTDKSLPYTWKDHKNDTHIYHLPQPSESFIQKYIECYNKGEIIKEVMVEFINKPQSYSDLDKLVEGTVYLSNPKINPKDNTIIIRKIKDNYSREELFPIIKKALNTKGVFNDEYTYKWIENNL